MDSKYKSDKNAKHGREEGEVCDGMELEGDNGSEKNWTKPQLRDLEEVVNNTVVQPKGKAKIRRSLIQERVAGESSLHRCNHHLQRARDIMNKRRRGPAATHSRGGRSDGSDEAVHDEAGSKDSIRSGKYNEDRDVCRALFTDGESDAVSDQIFRHLWKAIDGIENAISHVDPIIDRVHTNPFASDDTEDGMDQLEHVSDDDDDMEGYDSECDMPELPDDFPDQGRDMIQGRSIKFSAGEENRMVMQVGTRFHNGLVFRHALKAMAQRDGFKLCRVENSWTCISCECSDLRCEWHVEGRKIRAGALFEVTKLNAVHTCMLKHKNTSGTSKWVAYEFLHKWTGEPEDTARIVAQEIQGRYGVKCPKATLYMGQKIGREIVGTDHAASYTEIGRFAAAVEELSSSNKVLLETECGSRLNERRFRGIFVCMRETVWCFKAYCRHFIALDGWEIGGEYGGVVMTAVGVDGNNGIWPIALYEVQQESKCSWYDFLTKLDEVLRLDNGEDYCFMSDGDNGVDEALEEVLFRGNHRLCALKIYDRIRSVYECDELGDLFWLACRATEPQQFEQYMTDIKALNGECYAWLMDAGYQRWAVHCNPDSAKITHVTNNMSRSMRRWMQNYKAQSITRRFEGFVRKTKQLFDKRYKEVWEWRDKLTPVVKDKVKRAMEACEDMAVQDADGMIMNVLHKGVGKYTVDAEKNICTCGLWQLSGIPCAHACKFIKTVGWKAEDFVDPMLKKDNYINLYSVEMPNVPAEHFWARGEYEKILPPIVAHSTRRSPREETPEIRRAKTCGTHPTSEHDRNETPDWVAMENDVVYVDCSSGDDTSVEF